MIGNHTYDHPQAVTGSIPFGSFDELPVAVQEDQLDRTTAALIAATGIRQCYFRAPGGHDQASVATVRSRRMTSVNWNLSSGDSNQPPTTTTTTTTAAANRLVTAATSLVPTRVTRLMHDGKASAEPDSLLSSNRSNTVAALPRIISWYKNHGYAFVKPNGRAFLP